MYKAISNVLSQDKDRNNALRQWMEFEIVLFDLELNYTYISRAVFIIYFTEFNLFYIVLLSSLWETISSFYELQDDTFYAVFANFHLLFFSILMCYTIFSLTVVTM